MYPFSRLFFRIAAAALSGTAVVLACGAFFGIEVLRDRQRTVLAPLSISFESQLRVLVPPPQDKLPVVEFADSDPEKTSREVVEASELTPAVFALVTAMRTHSSGDSAYAAGIGVPPGIRHYAAGAVSFLNDQMEAAQAHFQAVLSLYNQQRSNREVWSHFMLGRAAAKRGEDAEAKSQFEAVRTLARRGSPDPLGFGRKQLRRDRGPP